jgi:hypothetical protein
LSTGLRIKIKKINFFSLKNLIKMGRKIMSRTSKYYENIKSKQFKALGLVSIAEAASILNVSQSFIRYLLKSGKLTHDMQIRNTKGISLEKIKAIIEGGKND